jgi:hypothetical protein
MKLNHINHLICLEKHVVNDTYLKLLTNTPNLIKMKNPRLIQNAASVQNPQYFNSLSSIKFIRMFYTNISNDEFKSDSKMTTIKIINKHRFNTDINCSILLNV